MHNPFPPGENSSTCWKPFRPQGHNQPPKHTHTPQPARAGQKLWASESVGTTQAASELTHLPSPAWPCSPFHRCDGDTGRGSKLSRVEGGHQGLTRTSPWPPLCHRVTKGPPPWWEHTAQSSRAAGSVRVHHKGRQGFLLDGGGLLRRDVSRREIISRFCPRSQNKLAESHQRPRLQISSPALI